MTLTTKAKSALAKMREEITATLISNMRRLYALLETGDKRLMAGENEDIYIEAAYVDDLPEVEVEVYDTYGLDGECDLMEPREISALAVSAGEFWLRTTEDDEVYADDLTVEELAEIADAIEIEYKTRVMEKVECAN